jgi:hypothetical protein
LTEVKLEEGDEGVEGDIEPAIAVEEEFYEQKDDSIIDEDVLPEPKPYQVRISHKTFLKSCSD